MFELPLERHWFAWDRNGPAEVEERLARTTRREVDPDRLMGDFAGIVEDVLAPEDTAYRIRARDR